MNVLTGLAGVVGLIGLGIVYATLGTTEEASTAAASSAKIAKDELELTHRPWLRGTFKMIRAYVFDDGAIHFAWQTTIRNVGNSPAIFASASGYPMLVSGMHAYDYADAIKWACDLARSHVRHSSSYANRNDSIEGATLFPGDEYTRPRWLTGGMTDSIQFVGPPERDDVDRPPRPIIAFCIAYAFGYDSKRIDTTAYVFSVGLSPGHSFSPGADIPTEALFLEPYVSVGTNEVIGWPYPTPTPEAGR